MPTCTFLAPATAAILVAQSRHFGFDGYRISPDRSLVLAATWTNMFPWANTLYAVRLDGSGEQLLTDKMYAYHMNQIGITPFAFTADGTRVIYVGPQDSTAGIYAASLDGSTNTKIADGYGFVVSPFADRVAAIDSRLDTRSKHRSGRRVGHRQRVVQIFDEQRDADPRPDVRSR